MYAYKFENVRNIIGHNNITYTGIHQLLKKFNYDHDIIEILCNHARFKTDYVNFFWKKTNTKNVYDKNKKIIKEMIDHLI